MIAFGDASALVKLYADVLDGAVQLSCALAVRRIDPACSTLAALDRVLRGAAAVEGFALLPAD